MQNVLAFFLASGLKEEFFYGVNFELIRTENSVSGEMIVSLFVFVSDSKYLQLDHQR